VGAQAKERARSVLKHRHAMEMESKQVALSVKLWRSTKTKSAGRSHSEMSIRRS